MNIPPRDPREEWIANLVKFLAVKRRHDVVIFKDYFSLKFMWLIKDMCYIMTTDTSYFLDKNDVWSIKKEVNTVYIEVLKRSSTGCKKFPINRDGKLFYTDCTDVVRTFDPILSGTPRSLDYLNELLNARQNVTYKHFEFIWFDGNHVGTFPEVADDLMSFIKDYETLVLDKLKQDQENERRERYQQKMRKYAELMQNFDD